MAGVASRDLQFLDYPLEQPLSAQTNFPPLQGQLQGASLGRGDGDKSLLATVEFLFVLLAWISWSSLVQSLSELGNSAFGSGVCGDILNVI